MAISDELIRQLFGHELVVIEGTDGTGKTSLAGRLAGEHGYAIVHRGRPPDGRALFDRYAADVATPGKVVLDRCFISELVYGMPCGGASRLSALEAAELALRVADRGGVFVHLTGSAETIAARLAARDGFAPPLERIRARLEAYRAVFDGLADAAPIITVTADEAPGGREDRPGRA
jgi:thymidylate kinase